MLRAWRRAPCSLSGTLRDRAGGIKQPTGPNPPISGTLRARAREMGPLKVRAGGMGLLRVRAGGMGPLLRARAGEVGAGRRWSSHAAKPPCGGHATQLCGSKARGGGWLWMGQVCGSTSTFRSRARTLPAPRRSPGASTSTRYVHDACVYIHICIHLP